MELSQIVEALVFASPEPLKPKELLDLVKGSAKQIASDLDDGEEKEAVLEFGKIAIEDIEKAIEKLNGEYRETGRAFELAERATGWKLFSRTDYADWVAGLFDNARPSRLSPPALETLAIIAYRQPVTKAAVEAVRGVSVDGVLNTLLDRNLAKIAGRADLPGRPLLYETTESFLDHFGITDVEQLPNAAELRTMKLPDGEEPEGEVEQVEEQLVLSAVEKKKAEEDAAAGEKPADDGEEPADDTAEEVPDANVESVEDAVEDSAEEEPIEDAAGEETEEMEEAQV